MQWIEHQQNLAPHLSSTSRECVELQIPLSEYWQWVTSAMRWATDSTVWILTVSHKCNALSYRFHCLNTDSESQVQCVELQIPLSAHWQWVTGASDPIIIIIIIIFKGAIGDVYNLLTAPQTVLQQVRSSGPGAIMWESRATHRVFITCNLPCASWYEVTAQLFSLIEFKHIYLSYISLAEPSTNEGGEETGVPGENPRWPASENTTY